MEEARKKEPDSVMSDGLEQAKTIPVDQIDDNDRQIMNLRLQWPMRRAIKPGKDI